MALSLFYFSWLDHVLWMIGEQCFKTGKRAYKSPSKAPIVAFESQKSPTSKRNPNPKSTWFRPLALRKLRHLQNFLCIMRAWLSSSFLIANVAAAAPFQLEKRATLQGRVAIKNDPIRPELLVDLGSRLATINQTSTLQAHTAMELDL